jgi:hypothetical protein
VRDDEVTGTRSVFLDYCDEALRRLARDPSPEARSLASELEGLQQTMIGWRERPSDKQRVIAAVLDVYSRALRLTAREKRA